MSNLPDWLGASAVYSKAYRYLEKNGAHEDLIDALNKGDEERIKGILLQATTREWIDETKSSKWRNRTKALR